MMVDHLNSHQRPYCYVRPLDISFVCSFVRYDVTTAKLLVCVDFTYFIEFTSSALGLAEYGTFSIGI